ncbi:MAG: ferrous iron transport protein A [Oligoflexia bacterium]|nr:ferrous iron transport protein A [Oligoflexia bacterium]
MSPTHKERTTLGSIKAGSVVEVMSVSTVNRRLCNKLLTMGIVAGTIIDVLSVAPLGDPIKIKAKGYHLSLRIAEAEHVHVRPVAQPEHRAA